MMHVAIKTVIDDAAVLCEKRCWVYQLYIQFKKCKYIYILAC